LEDLFGKALLDYHQSPGKHQLLTWTSLTEEDPVPLAYFFRDYKEMPNIEQKALALSHGKVLDIGCGSGSHSLYLQNEKGFAVTALDSSFGAAKIAKERGVNHVFHQSILDFNKGTFDTLLLMMNGLGVAKDFQGVLPLLQHLKTLLNPEGQILLDSSDLIYLFEEEEQEDWRNAETYYGELEFGIGFKDETEEFPWLYLDFEHLSQAAELAGLNCEKILDGPNYDFLARLTIA